MLHVLPISTVLPAPPVVLIRPSPVQQARTPQEQPHVMRALKSQTKQVMQISHALQQVEAKFLRAAKDFG